MGVDFKKYGLYISYNFADMSTKYGGYRAYIDVPLYIAIATIRYQLKLLAEDGYYPVQEDKIPTDNGDWYWGVNKRTLMCEAERRIVYATILRCHLNVFEKHLPYRRNTIIRSDSSGLDENPLLYIGKIDAVRKIQKWYIYNHHRRIIREKYSK
jgi:hypothetical protein